MAEKYDRDGKPMTQDEFQRRWDDHDYRVIAKSKVGESSVSTVWLGMDNGWGDGAPLIFETMIFDGPHSDEQWEYATEVEARRHHHRLVHALKREPFAALPDPEPVA